MLRRGCSSAGEVMVPWEWLPADGQVIVDESEWHGGFPLPSHLELRAPVLNLPVTPLFFGEDAQHVAATNNNSRHLWTDRHIVV